MRLPFLQLTVAIGLLSAVSIARSESATSAPKPPQAVVWEAKLARYDEATYARDVEALIANFEATSGKRLVPV